MSLPAGILTKGQSIAEEEISNVIKEEGEKLPRMPISRNRRNYDDAVEEISFMQWMIAMILYSVPIINIIYLIVSLVKEDNLTKKNWLKAASIMTAISIIAFIIMIIVLKNTTVAQLFELYSQYAQ